MKQVLPFLLLVCAPAFAAVLDLSHAVVVTAPGPLANAESTAATVLRRNPLRMPALRAAFRAGRYPIGGVAGDSLAERAGAALREADDQYVDPHHGRAERLGAGLSP